MNNNFSASCEIFFAWQTRIRQNEAIHTNYTQLIKIIAEKIQTSSNINDKHFDYKTETSR